MKHDLRARCSITEPRNRKTKASFALYTGDVAFIADSRTGILVNRE